MRQLQRKNRMPRALGFAVSAFVAAGVQAQPQGGYTVDDVVGQFGKIARHGDPLGFRSVVGVDADLCKHYQGIARYNAADGTPYFFVTHSMNHTSSCGLSACDFDCSDDPGELLVVRMGSRPKHRERMRSNRLALSQNHSDTQPPSNDVDVLSIRFQEGTGWPGFQHPGDGQIVDDVLVIPLEREIPGADNRSTILFIDVSDPENPMLLKDRRFDGNLGVLAIAWDQPRNAYILCVAGGDTRVLQFYETTVSDLYDPALDLTPISTYDIDTDAPASVRDKWEKWQNLDFIRQTDGRLFMACADNTGFTDMGEDWIRLFEVTQGGSGISLSYTGGERHLKLDDPRMGNGAAGTGYYVSPAGNLILYTCEHEDGGPGGSVRCGEFRSIDVSLTGVDPSNDVWVELYQKDNGWTNSADEGKSLMMDVCDVNLENWQDLDDEDGWGDDAHSLRWRAPAGHEILVFKNQNFGGDVLRLMGNGSVRAKGDLDSDNFGGDIHSVFAGARPVPGAGDIFSEHLQLNSFATSLSYQGTLTLSLTHGWMYQTASLWYAYAPNYTTVIAPQGGGFVIIAP